MYKDVTALYKAKSQAIYKLNYIFLGQFIQLSVAYLRWKRVKPMSSYKTGIGLNVVTYIVFISRYRETDVGYCIKWIAAWKIKTRNSFIRNAIGDLFI